MSKKDAISKASRVFIAPSAVLEGSIHLESEVSIWHGAVLRADEGTLFIGRGSNIQDLCLVHCEEAKGLHVGQDVTVGHGAIVHGAFIGDETLIGMGAILLAGSRVGAGCILAAGSLLPEGAVIPDGEVWMGTPARKLRETTPEDMARIRSSSAHYQEQIKERNYE
ncbi:hypothetical protein ABB02_01616 [Clostridiaceae bacterium JG1575]|nr:hypothetical protein ABB02_01616 [Clostridiaceae bacterium JG1575]